MSRFFVQKWFEKLFFYLQLGFEIFLGKNISAKAASKMLVKLIPAVQEVPVRQVLGGGDGPEVGLDERREEKKIRKVFQEERRGDKNTKIF